MSKKTSTSSKPPKEYRPYIQSGLNANSTVFNENQAATQNIANSVQGLIPGLIDKYNTGNPMLKAAQGYGQDVLNGDYLNGNPYLNGMIDQTANDVTNRVNANFGSRGSFGGSFHTQALARELANAENQMRFGNYNQERGYQQQAMAGAPAQAAADYMGISPLLQAAQTGVQLPYAGINSYSGNLAGLVGNSSTQKSSDGGAGLGSALSSLGMLAFMSDPRAKKDVRKVGELEDGLGVYEFRYKWDADDSPILTGVMADEVEALRPWALGPVIDGYKTVVYGAL